MTGTFNKHDFATRLEFFIRYWQSLAPSIMRNNSLEDAQVTMNFFWMKASDILWQTRCDGVVVIGIDDKGSHKAFCSLMNVGLNQMNVNIQSIMTSDTPPILKITKMNLEIKEKVAELADDVEDYLKTIQHATI